MSKNVACVDNISKKKSSPALALFIGEMTTALEFECGNEAKGTCPLLRMLNDCTMQPLLTVSMSKGNELK